MWPARGTRLCTHRQFVLLRQLIHTKNGNDILERLVVLKDLLNGSCNLVVFFADLCPDVMSDLDSYQGKPLTMRGSSMRDFESRGSTAGYIPSSAIERDNTVVASKWAKVVAGAGSVRSSAGTYTACTEVMEPFLVVVMRSCLDKR